MMYRLQGSRQEVIQDFYEMMVEQLEHFQKNVPRLPSRILYYRDGVSEGQFSQVSTTHSSLNVLLVKIPDYFIVIT